MGTKQPVPLLQLWGFYCQISSFWANHEATESVTNNVNKGKDKAIPSQA
jgi:hypothetical protein